MKAEHGIRVYDRIANETASAGNGHRLAPAAASILLNDTTPPGPPTRAAFRPTLEASRWRSGNFRENITINKQTTTMKTRSMKSILVALAGSILLFLALLLMVGNLLADIALALADPRIRLE